MTILLDGGADPAVQDALYHGTPLGWAQQAGQAEVAKLLEDTA